GYMFLCFLYLCSSYLSKSSSFVSCFFFAVLSRTVFYTLSLHDALPIWSDVDAALYYLAILLEAGELIIACRRLLVIAYEDIGLGNPQATERTVAAVEAAEKLGLPEARIPLAFATVELALSPKSNTTMVALDSALTDIRSGNIGPIPDHLRDAHYSGATKLGRGVEYK